MSISLLSAELHLFNCAYVCLHVRTHICMYVYKHVMEDIVEVRGQLTEISSLLLPCGSQRWNLDSQAW